MKKIAIVVLLLGISIFILFKGWILEDLEEEQLKRRAINYFCEKHNAKKEDVKIIDNYLYGKNENCSLGCYDSSIRLMYDDIEYTVEYNVDKDYFTDDTPNAELKYTLSKAIKNKFDFVLVEIDTQHIKYYSDETTYKNVKYIEKHIRNKGGFYGDLSVKIYIDTDTESMAKKYYEKYIKEILQYMETLEVNYSIFIGSIDENFPDVYYMSPEYYELYISKETFRLFDNINNKKIDGPKADYINGEFME